jgi:cytochrome c oxidase assembly factor CtaG
VSAIPQLSTATLLEQWYAAPLALVTIVALLSFYVHGLRTLARRGISWPRHRTVSFGLGIILLTYLTCGAPQVYGRTLFSMWTGQMLTLLLIIPGILMAGQPVELGRLVSGPDSIGVRFLNSRLGQTLASPLVGPVIIPVVSALIFFGPVPGWAVQWPAFSWVLQLVLVGLGAMIVLPLVATDDSRGSLAVAAAMGIGFLELLLDAIPGIVLRLQTHISSTFFEHRLQQSWSPIPLHDQQIAGGVLWCAAELLDLPFLLLVFRRWMRADARDAREIDTVLEAERISRGMAGDGDDTGAPTSDDTRDQPWWLNDPTLKSRYRE